MIAVIDYGAGNLRNVCKALEHVGADLVLTDDVRELERADKLVLPGVGAFADCMNGLTGRALNEPLRRLALDGKPLLGICVGMQLLFDTGEEMGEWPGLGLIPGRVVRFKFDAMKNTEHRAHSTESTQHSALNTSKSALKVPHIGWNQIEPRQEHAVLKGVPAGSYAYFVHSFYPEPQDERYVVATTAYGYSFASVVARDRIWGIQFHPEKSQDIGLQMLRNFVEAA
jgi:imidazole glycerol-phosphate synthase subunit HisH